MSDNYYLDISLDKCEESDYNSPNPTAEELKDYILYSIRSLFGEFGASCTVDLLKFHPRGIIVRVSSASCVKLRGSLALAPPFRGTILRIQSFSPFLPSLTANSRTYRHF